MKDRHSRDGSTLEQNEQNALNIPWKNENNYFSMEFSVRLTNFIQV